MSEAAVKFLQQYGQRSLVSLGCGNVLNRLDNHVRLFVRRGIEYYVGIDRVAKIECNPDSVFSNRESVMELLASYYGGEPATFFKRVRTFPNTCVEELSGIRCKVVVCQRVLPFRHWEDIIKTMQPELMLQEDLNGCELQNIRGELYQKTFPGILHYQLKPFRPTRLIPGERNLILWRRKDFFPCRRDMDPWWKRLLLRLSWA